MLICFSVCVLLCVLKSKYKAETLTQTLSSYTYRPPPPIRTGLEKFVLTLLIKAAVMSVVEEKEERKREGERESPVIYHRTPRSDSIRAKPALSNRYTIYYMYLDGEIR